jgi:putative transposase
VQKQYSSDLTDSQWQVISKYIHYQRESKYAYRRIVEAINYICKNGCVWRDLPIDFPPWQIVYYYFHKWDKDATIDLIMNELHEIKRVKVGKKPIPTALIVDSQSVKNTPTATQDIGVDGGKLIKGRKRLYITDTMGNLMYVKVSAANEHDSTIAKEAFESALLESEMFGYVSLIYADSAFGGSFKEWANEKQIEVEVPKTYTIRSTEGNFYISPRRWVVERSIAWSNNGRRLTKDYERKVSTSEAFIKWQAIRLAL